MGILTAATFNFLDELKANNHKTWFDANRPAYEKAYAEVIAFADRLLDLMSEWDVLDTPSGKKSLYRIYRDVRFSKDKTPYKTYWRGHFSRSGAERRGGFSFTIGPGINRLAGGFWAPNSDDLLLLRKQIQADAEPLREVLTNQDFRDYFGSLLGEQVKSAPRGFSKTDPAIDLLRYKQFLVRHSFSDEDALAEDFAEQVATGFKNMLPFFEVMTSYLTTNLDGVSMI